MKSTFRILFYLKKNEPKKDGTVTIMARITVDGETKQFSTKKTILPEDWDIKSGRAVNKSGKSTSAKISKLNKELDDLRGQISIQYTKQLNNNGYVEPEKLRNKVLGIEEKQHSLLTYFTEHNLQYKDKVGTTATQKTYSRYELTKQRLIDFMKVKYRVSDILIREINAVFIENFYLYLRNEHGINNNTAMKFLQRFHSILIYAKNSGLNFIDPFGSFKFSFDKVDRGYLNQDEIDLIYNKEFSSARLTQVRDMFIFSCYTGLSYIDLCNLTKENIRLAFDGKLWIMTKREKTGVDSNVPLLEIPKQILAKYEGKMKGGKLLPVISNQKMNEYLGEIAEVCQIDKRITFHLARHTFATEICLTQGVPIESVSKMLGHTNIQTTQIYARVVDRKLSHDMAVLEQKLQSKGKRSIAIVNP